jgi:hypothetical protein
MIVFLSHEEVCELTGAKTKSGQIRNLQSNSIRHTIKTSGWPCVTVFAVTGQGEAPAIEEAPTWVPDISKVR